MATRHYYRYSPSLGREGTTTLEANATYKVDMGPTLGWMMILGSDATEAKTFRSGPYPVGKLGTQPGQPLV